MPALNREAEVREIPTERKGTKGEGSRMRSSSKGPEKENVDTRLGHVRVRRRSSIVKFCIQLKEIHDYCDPVWRREHPLKLLPSVFRKCQISSSA